MGPWKECVWEVADGDVDSLQMFRTFGYPPDGAQAKTLN